MRKRFDTIALAALAAALVATPATAQLTGQPVYAIPGGTGVSLNADVGVSIDPSGFNSFAGRASLGLPMIGLTAAFQPEVLDAVENSIMFGGAVTVLPLPTTSIRLQANVGYGLDSEILRVPIGAVLDVRPPTPAISVNPWVFPSFRITRVSFLGTTETSTGVGVAAGLNVGLPGGLGGHVALDYDADSEVLVAGFGVHYKISVPGLGMVPGM